MTSFLTLRQLEGQAYPWFVFLILFPIMLTSIAYNAVQNFYPQGRMGAPSEGGSSVEKVSIFFTLRIL